jgi:hypothetical protein
MMTPPGLARLPGVFVGLSGQARPSERIRQDGGADATGQILGDLKILD